MMSSSGFQHVNGLRLYVHRYRDEGAAPSGLTIVLLHGFMDSGATWDMVAPVLARGGHDVIAPDLRGFGQSEYVGAGGYYHFPDYVADLAALVDAMAPRRLAIVGHSMGGTVAALYTGTYPEKVERLALLEGTGPIATDPPLAVDRMAAWLRTMREVSRTPKPLSSMQEAVERLSLHHPRVPREVIESRARLLTRTDDTGRLLWAYDPLHRTTAPTPFSVESFHAFLRRIECPTLVVSGGPLGWHPPDEAQRVACLKHALFMELPNAGHMMHWTEPTSLGGRLSQFFGEPPPAKPRPAQPSAASMTTPPVSPPPSHATPSHATPSHAAPHSPPQAPAQATAPGMPPPSWSGAAAPQSPPHAIPAPAPSRPGVTDPGWAGSAAATPGTTTPGRPIYGGAAADLGSPAAGAAPAAPTRPSSGTPGGSTGNG